MCWDLCGRECPYMFTSVVWPYRGCYEAKVEHLATGVAEHQLINQGHQSMIGHSEVCHFLLCCKNLSKLMCDLTAFIVDMLNDAWHHFSTTGTVDLCYKVLYNFLSTYACLVIYTVSRYC